MEIKSKTLRYRTDEFNPIVLSLLILGVIEPTGISQQASLFGGIWRFIHVPFVILVYFSFFASLILFVFDRKKKVDFYTILIVLYWLWIIFVNLFKGLGVWGSTFQALKVLSSILIMKHCITKKHFNEYVKTLSFWFVLFTILNIIIQLLFPLGWYIDERNWGMWLLGNRNAFVFHYYLTIVFFALYQYSEFKKLKFSFFVLVALVLFSEIYGGSVTSGISIVIVVGMIVFLRNIMLSKYKICLIALLVSVVSSYVLINIGVNTTIRRLFELYFSRNATFSGRTEIWDGALQSLEGHFVTGNGWAEIPLNNWYWDVFQCHNHYLDLLFTGGIIGITIFLLLVIVSIRKMNYKGNNAFCAILAFVFIGYCITYLMEARRKDVGIYLVLTMMYYSSSIMSQK